MLQSYYEYDSKFKVLALTICSKLKFLGLKAYIIKFSTKNSIYIQLGDTDDVYFRIRISDHQGRTEARYTLRSDVKNSEKRWYPNSGEHFIYTTKDTNSFWMRLTKDVPYLKANCVKKLEDVS